MASQSNRCVAKLSPDPRAMSSRFSIPVVNIHSKPLTATTSAAALQKMASHSGPLLGANKNRYDVAKHPCAEIHRGNHVASNSEGPVEDIPLH